MEIPLCVDPLRQIPLPPEDEIRLTVKDGIKITPIESVFSIGDFCIFAVVPSWLVADMQNYKNNI